MGRLEGFKEEKRKTHAYVPAEERKKNFDGFIKPIKKEEAAKQGARCMDCGTPFCNVGCPLGNIIPDFNHQVYLNNYKRAYQILKNTNNFPGITGRICPAPCESACVLSINKPAVSIKTIELAIAEEAEREGWETIANPPKKRSGKKVSIIGSGPAGLAAADQLNQAGHYVTVYEKSNKLGGLLTYGVPNFKLPKKLIENEIKRMQAEGIKFITGIAVGHEASIDTILSDCDAIVIAIGSSVPRDLLIENRSSKGIYFAMQFLTQATAEILNKPFAGEKVDVAGKDVLVIGGGDTGSDCIGTSIRKKAKSVMQIEIMAIPPKQRDQSMPWPQYERIFRVSTSQEEGCTRLFSVLSTRFLQENDKVTGLEIEEIAWNKKLGTFQHTGKKSVLKADVILLALGFLHPNLTLANTLGLSLDKRNNYLADDKTYKTNRDGIFVAGDARRGQSLVVWAISEGRECAKSVDEYLRNSLSSLKAKNFENADYANHFKTLRANNTI